MEVNSPLPEWGRRWPSAASSRLRYFEDLSLAEVTGVMDCTPMAAKLRVFRAMTALRKRWHSAPPEGDWVAG